MSVSALALATRRKDVALQSSTRFALARVYGDHGDYRQAVDIWGTLATVTDDVLPQLAQTLGPGATRARAALAWSLAELGAFQEGLRLLGSGPSAPSPRPRRTFSVSPVRCGPRATSTCCVATSPMPCPCWPRVSRSARPAKCIFCSPD